MTNEERCAGLTWLIEAPFDGKFPGLAERLQQGKEAALNGGLGSGVTLFTDRVAGDAKSAGGWLGSQRGRPYYDGFAAALTLAIAKESPEVAAAWAMTLRIHPPGTSHHVTGEAGCVVLAIYEKPVRWEPRAPEGTAFHGLRA